MFSESTFSHCMVDAPLDMPTQALLDCAIVFLFDPIFTVFDVVAVFTRFFVPTKAGFEELTTLCLFLSRLLGIHHFFL